jgi:hypothetical protein
MILITYFWFFIWACLFTPLLIGFAYSGVGWKGRRGGERSGEERGVEGRGWGGV